jgi:hypothetical protein
VRITILLLLFGVYWAINFLETPDKNTPAIITEDNIRRQNNLVGMIIAVRCIGFFYTIFNFMVYSYCTLFGKRDKLSKRASSKCCRVGTSPLQVKDDAV